MTGQKGNKEKVQELLKKAEHFQGSGSEMLHHAMMKQARDACDHSDVETEIREEYTADARKRKVRYETCSICGASWTETIEEEKVSSDAAWN